MATSGGLVPNEDTFASWPTSPGGAIWQVLRDQIVDGDYVYSGFAGHCEVGLENPNLSAGYGVKAVSLSCSWTSDPGVVVHIELWRGGTHLASSPQGGGSTALSWSAATPFRAGSDDLRMRLVADSVPGNLFARAQFAGGSWSGALLPVPLPQVSGLVMLL